MGPDHMTPFRSFSDAAEAVLDASSTDELTHRLLATLLATEERANRAEAEASTDPLTGTGSRRFWERTTQAEERRCARYGHPACVIVVDVDELKTVNDTRGHRAGDHLLRSTADALVSASRSTDAVARVGGDEFTILAVDSDLETGQILVERLAAALDEVGVRASIGLAERDPQRGLAAAWIEADEQMYAAKQRRRQAVPAR